MRSPAAAISSSWAASIPSYVCRSLPYDGSVSRSTTLARSWASVLSREASSASASAMHCLQKSNVSGTLAGKSRKQTLCRTWSPTISRTVSSVRAAVAATVSSHSPDRRSITAADSLKPTDISAASNCRAATSPCPAGPEGAGRRWVCRMTRGSRGWAIRA